MNIPSKNRQRGCEGTAINNLLIIYMCNEDLPDLVLAFREIKKYLRLKGPTGEGTRTYLCYLWVFSRAINSFLISLSHLCNPHINRKYKNYLFYLFIVFLFVFILKCCHCIHLHSHSLFFNSITSFL